MNKDLIYTAVIFILFMWALGASKKYMLLKDAYQKAVTEKVQFCKENKQLKCELVKAEYEAEKLFDLGLEN